jgi:hypothetical protein
LGLAKNDLPVLENTPSLAFPIDLPCSAPGLASFWISEVAQYQRPRP